MIRNWEDWVLTQSFWLYLHCCLRTCSKPNYQITCVKICKSVLLVGSEASHFKFPGENSSCLLYSHHCLVMMPAENISCDPTLKHTRFFTEGSWHSLLYWWMGLLGSLNGGHLQQQFWYLGWNILPERLLFLLLLSKVVLLLLLSINQDLREEEEEICGRTSNVSPASPKGKLRKFLSSSVF